MSKTKKELTELIKQSHNTLRFWSPNLIGLLLSLAFIDIAEYLYIDSVEWNYAGYSALLLLRMADIGAYRRFSELADKHRDLIDDAYENRNKKDDE